LNVVNYAPKINNQKKRKKNANFIQHGNGTTNDQDETAPNKEVAKAQAGWDSIHPSYKHPTLQAKLSPTVECLLRHLVVFGIMTTVNMLLSEQIRTICM
jgi:hypothetical protein